MELRDFIVTPIIIMAIYAVAYMIRPRVTDSLTRKYFFPALTLKIFGALAVGFIYQFYYGGGDTLNYHTHGSRVIYDAFLESPVNGIKIFFSHGTFGPGMWDISDKIWYWRDPQSFKVIQIATLLDFITFSTYSATAALFAVIAFCGAWMLFITFYNRHPQAHQLLAISCLFIPSVIFWGSGIFKDTLTLAGIGLILYCLNKMLIQRKISFLLIIGLIFSIWMIFSLKKYILLCFLPVIVLWLFSLALTKVRAVVFKMLLIPVALVPVFFLIYFILLKVGEDDPRYNVNKLAETARITAYDIRYGWGARSGDGSGYALGELDGTWQSMIKLAPSAINVSLFRPYVWEISSPLMVLSALESTALFFLTFYVIYKSRTRMFRYLQNPEVILCLGFSIVFAFAVGVSTYNFGSLSRYKIPLLPFYAMALSLLYYYSKRDKKLEQLDRTE